MQQADFEQAFCVQSQITQTEYELCFDTSPCTCGYPHCVGWAAVIKGDKDVETVRCNGLTV